MAYSEEKKIKNTELRDKMATTEFTNELLSLIKARQPLIYLVEKEERRFLQYFAHLTVAGGYKCYVWDIHQGLLDLADLSPAKIANQDDIKEPEQILDFICKEAISKNQSETYEGKYNGFIYILLDFHRFLKDADPRVERRLKTFARAESLTSIIMTGPHYETTAGLDKEMSMVEFPFPNREEIKNALYSVVEGVSDKCTGLKKETEKREASLIDAVTGLTLNEAQSAYAKSLVLHKDFKISTILKEKQQIIRKSGILDYLEPTVSLKDIGGLSVLIAWLKKRKMGFHPDAAAYGLTAPKGCILLGIPGTGKSLAAKAISAEYEIPLLRLDFGKMFSSLIGDSEKTVRDAIRLSEALSPCVLFIDELDKAVSGHQSSGQTDGGTTSRVIGTFLTWMQEKVAPVFVIATANNHENIPTEMMRSGRFDEMFFLNLPTQIERAEIFEVLLARKKRKLPEADLKRLAQQCEHYSGAEIEKAIEMALFEGFGDNKREITTEDIEKALDSFEPLYSAKKEQFEEMKNWAEGRCLIANTPDIVVNPLNTKKQIQM